MAERIPTHFKARNKMTKERDIIEVEIEANAASVPLLLSVNKCGDMLNTKERFIGYVIRHIESILDREFTQGKDIQSIIKVSADLNILTASQAPKLNTDGNLENVLITAKLNNESEEIISCDDSHIRLNF